MKYRKTFKDAWDETKLQSVNEQEENQDSDEIKKLKDEIQQWKLKYQQAKIDKSAPVPNPDTGEVPLQTGIANALLRAKDKKEADEKETESKSAKIEKLAKESLVQTTVDIIRESEASDKAKGMGLDYMSFGRYGKDGKVTHKNIGGALTAVDKDEKPIKEPEKGKKADEPKDKADSGKEVSNDGVGVQPPEARKMARDFLKDVHADDFDAYFDAAGVDDEDDTPLNNAVGILRDSEQEDLANDLEDIASDFAEMEDDAQEKLDDFKDRLKGKRPAVPEAIKKHSVVNDLYKNQQYSKTNFSKFTKDTVNHLKSLTKVLDAGSRTGHPDEPMAPAGLRQDQIAAVQDSMETLKDQLIDMNMDTGDVMDDIEFVTDRHADHDEYTKGSRIKGTIEDIMNRFTNLNRKENYSPARNKFNEVLSRVEQQNEKENEDKELDIDDVANQSTKKKIKLDKKKTEIKIDPEVNLGQISGGTKVNTGNLH